MKLRKTHLVFVLLGLGLNWSCTTSDTTTADPDIFPEIVIDPSGFSSDSWDKALSIEDIEVIKFTMPDSSILANTDQVTFFGNYIYIIDKYQEHSISIFDREGTFLRKIHTIGRGPNEYINLTDVKINPKNGDIQALVNNARLFYSYDSVGNYKSQSTIGFSGLVNFWPIGDYFVIYNGLQIPLSQQGKTNTGYRVSYYDENFIPLTNYSFLPFQFNDKDEPESSSLQSNFAPLYNVNDTLTMFETLSDTIYTVTVGSVSPRYIIRFEGEDSALKTKILNDRSLKNKSDAFRKKRLSNITNYMENDKIILLQYSYYNKAINGYLIGYALYDKTNQETTVFPNYYRLPLKSDIGRVRLNAQLLPQFMDDQGRLVSVISPIYLHELQGEAGQGIYADEKKFFDKIYNRTKAMNDINIEGNVSLLLFKISK